MVPGLGPAHAPRLPRAGPPSLRAASPLQPPRRAHATTPGAREAPACGADARRQSPSSPEASPRPSVRAPAIPALEPDPDEPLARMHHPHCSSGARSAGHAAPASERHPGGARKARQARGPERHAMHGGRSALAPHPPRSQDRGPPPERRGPPGTKVAPTRRETLSGPVLKPRGLVRLGMWWKVCLQGNPDLSEAPCGTPPACAGRLLSTPPPRPHRLRWPEAGRGRVQLSRRPALRRSTRPGPPRRRRRRGPGAASSLRGPAGAYSNENGAPGTRGRWARSLRARRRQCAPGRDRTANAQFGIVKRIGCERGSPRTA